MTLYREVAVELRRRILEGELPEGARMPSEQRLAAEYGVSRGVVRNALASLQRRGLVSAKAGFGWRVGGGDHVFDLSELRSFSQWAGSRGLRAEGRIVDRTRRHPSAAEARELRIGTREEALQMTRLRSLEERAVLVERNLFAPSMLPFVEELPVDTPSITRALADSGVRVAHGASRIDTVPASAEDAVLLGVRRTVRLLRVQRAAFAPDGRPIYRAEDRYAPDTIAFALNAAAPRTARPGAIDTELRAGRRS